MLTPFKAIGQEVKLVEQWSHVHVQEILGSDPGHINFHFPAENTKIVHNWPESVLKHTKVIRK